MQRRIAASAALLAVLILAPDCSSKAPADASGMNLLVITLDTTRADALGLYGNTRRRDSPGSTSSAGRASSSRSAIRPFP